MTFDEILARIRSLNAPLPPAAGMLKEVLTDSEEPLLPRMAKRTPPGYIYDTGKKLFGAMPEHYGSEHPAPQKTPTDVFAEVKRRLQGMNAPLPPAMGMIKEAISPSSDAPLPFRMFGRTPPGYVGGAIGDLFDLPSKGYPLPLRILSNLGVKLPCSGGNCSTTYGGPDRGPLDSLSKRVR